MSTKERMPQITLTAICWRPHCLQREMISCHSFLSVREWGEHERGGRCLESLGRQGGEVLIVRSEYSVPFRSYKVIKP